MKLLIVLFVLAAIALCSSSEKIQGRFSNTRTEQLLGNKKDSPSIGRSFYHKNKGNQGGASIILIPVPSYDFGGGFPEDYEEEEEFDIDSDLDVTIAEETRGDNDDDFLDSEDEVDNEQTSIRSKKRNSNIILKKSNGKKQVRRFKVPAKPRFEKSAPSSSSATSKNGGNKLHVFRLNGSNNVNRNSDNFTLRRLFIQQ